MTVPPPSAPAPDDVPPVEPRTESEDADGTEEGTQEARAAQRELFPHTPAFILDRTGFGGSLVGGAQHGVSGGGVAGDVFLGGRTENHYYNGAAAGATHVSGEIPRGDLDALTARSSSKARPSRPRRHGCARSASWSWRAPTRAAGTPPRACCCTASAYRPCTPCPRRRAPRPSPPSCRRPAAMSCATCR
ncbi:hypothetical protein [Streptomyces sp. NPDC058066]|uniref:hypothetical protein n=1 Tax=Streptomyces sp. NPDC058066 TaxID=3346323 RepID=UPI0036E91FD9